MIYKGFKYWQDGRTGKWCFQFPSGLLSTLPFDSEDALKAHLDMLEAEYANK